MTEDHAQDSQLLEFLLTLLRDLKFAALACPCLGACRHRGAHAGAGHRRQRPHLRRGVRCAAAAARQPRRGPADLHPPKCARHGRRQRCVLRGEMASVPRKQGGTALAASRPPRRSGLRSGTGSPGWPGQCQCRRRGGSFTTAGNQEGALRLWVMPVRLLLVGLRQTTNRYFILGGLVIFMPMAIPC